jgi:hypothetical protein
MFKTERPRCRSWVVGFGASSATIKGGAILLFRIATFALFACNCGSLARHVLVSVASPDGRQRITVSQRFHGADASIDVDLDEGSRTKRIYADGADRAPGLIEVYWSTSGGSVGILVCDPASAEHFVIVGYDRHQERALASTVVAGPLARVLVQRYHLSSTQVAAFGGDPISWACSQFSDSRDRFNEAIGHAKKLSPVNIQ